ncbi:hypothetical protein Y032_0014g2426 [Ancylostoma ceylanicum]|uniref:Uncharacterized protein n=1 Tax=Ancylostoma ceylanicum TaxID=53326 RepID=A0A016VAJ4_9BILA|nr:hypothetical protein Y032_0014g2426 [Ancylostoma ceylanicum]
MNFIFFLVAFLLSITRRSDASFPVAMNGYYPYIPYAGAMTIPAPVVHAAPSFFPYPMTYYHPHRELHNVAGAIQREDGLITDVSMKFPLSRKN